MDEDLRNRYRTDLGRGEQAHPVTAKATGSAPAEIPKRPEAPTVPHKKAKKRRKKLVLLLAIIFVLMGVAGAGAWWYTNRNISPVPKNVQESVSFPVYYPDPKKMPAGYTLDANSFSMPQKNGILYRVGYGNGKKLVFSIQPKPSDSDLQSFNASYIPLHNDYQTPVGKAELGAYNAHGTLETLVSLPTNDKTWIIITAPYDIDQTQLKQVLQSIRQ